MAETKKKAKKEIHGKGDIVSLVANSVDDVSKASVLKVIDATLDAIKKVVASDGRVVLVGFGTFERGERKARTGRNPQTGKEIKIAAANTARFKAGTAFKDLVNK